MAGVMVVGRLLAVPVERPKRSNAAPDFESFQKLLKAANQNSAATALKIRYAECAEFDQLVAESKQAGNDKTRGSGAGKHILWCDHDFEVLLKEAVTVVVPKERHRDGMYLRRARNVARRFEDIASRMLPSDTELAFPHSWEADITWNLDDSSFCEPNLREESAFHLFPQNGEISCGKWVEAIIWNDAEYDPDREAYMENLSAVVKVNFDELRIKNFLIADFNSNFIVPSEEDTDDESLEEMNDDGVKVAQNVNSDIDQTGKSDTEIATRGSASMQLPAVLDRFEKAKRLEREKKERLKKWTEKNAQVNSAASKLDDATVTTNLKRKQKLAINALEHSTVAIKHKGVRFVWRQMELKYYHRPRISKVLHTWSVTVEGHDMTPRPLVKTIALGSGEPAPVAAAVTSMPASDTKGPANTYAAQRIGMLQQRIDRAEDLCLYSGGDFICLEYIEETPNIMLDAGMSSRIINYFRFVRRHDKEEEEEGPDNKDGMGPQVVGEFSGRKRLPRHILGLQGQIRSGRKKWSTTDDDIDDNMDLPKFPEGITEGLEPQDEFPFLGEIAEGDAQQTIATNLFRAPIFKHHPKENDFLLIRNAFFRRGYHFVIRKIPKIFVVGQQEPLEIVPKPSRKKQMTPFQFNFTTFHLLKYFNLHSNRDLDYSDISNEFEPFSTRFKADFRKCLTRVAEEYEDGQTWRKRDASDLTRLQAELDKSFSPEDVCLHESQQSYEYKLEKKWGIKMSLETSKLEQCLGLLQRLKQFRRMRYENAKIKLKELQGSNDPRAATFAKLVEYLKLHMDLLGEKMDVGRFIHERVLLSPWNITESFVRGHLQRCGTGMLQLTGVPGDPSGIGEAFSYCRQYKNTEKNRADVGGVTEQIWDTDKDLRKLHSKDMIRTLIQSGKDPTELKGLKRWDLVYLIRQMGSKAADMGTAEGLHRFARDSKQSHQSQFTEYHNKCTTIWNRQVEALSNPEEPPDEEEIDEDEEMDEDDLADSLENELEAAQLTTQRNTVMNSKKSNPMDLIAAESDDKRELESLGSLFGNKKSAAKPSVRIAAPVGGRADTGSADAQQETFTLSHRPEKVVKRIVRTIKPDGTELVEVRFIVSESEVLRVERDQRKKAASLMSNSNSLAASLKSRGQRHKTHHKHDDHEFDEYEDPGGAVLKLSKLSKSAAKNTKRDRTDGSSDEEARFLMQSKRRRDNKRTVNIKRNLRLPQVIFAVSLEAQLMLLWNNKANHAFWYPVDSTLYPKYYSIVTTPMCLSDIRDNLARFKYKTVSSFLADFELIYTNSVAFNGADADITKNAKKLFTEATRLLSVEKQILGAEFDTFTVQENDIKTKYDYNL